MIRTALGAVADFIRDGTHGSPERTEAGVPVLSAMNVKGGRLNFETDRFTSNDEFAAFSRRVPLSDGDVLLTIVGTIGRAAVIEEVRPLVFQRSVAIIRPKAAVLDSRFLYHATQSSDFQTQLDRASNKSSQAGVYLGKLAEVLIPLPSLTEQRRIAAILDQADALRAKRREALAQLDRLTQAIFIDMFGESNAERVSLGQLVKLKSGEFLPAHRMSDDGPYPVLGGNGVNGHHHEYMFEDRRITIGRVGVYCGCVHISPPKSWITDNALYVSEIDDRVDFDFLATSLSFANLNQYASQSAQPLVSGGRLYPVQILVPPKNEQKVFVRMQREAGRIIEASRRSAAALDDFFASLQHRAFRGEL